MDIATSAFVLLQQCKIRHMFFTLSHMYMWRTLFFAGFA